MHNLALALAMHVKVHDALEGVHEFLKNAHKFQKISYSGIIPLVEKVKKRYLSICDMKSMTVYIGSITNQREVTKWLPFKNYKSESLDICIYGGYMCLCICHRVLFPACVIVNVVP